MVAKMNSPSSFPHPLPPHTQPLSSNLFHPLFFVLSCRPRGVHSCGTRGHRPPALRGRHGLLHRRLGRRRAERPGRPPTLRRPRRRVARCANRAPGGDFASRRVVFSRGNVSYPRCCRSPSPENLLPCHPLEGPGARRIGPRRSCAPRQEVRPPLPRLILHHELDSQCRHPILPLPAGCSDRRSKRWPPSVCP